MLRQRKVSPNLLKFWRQQNLDFLFKYSDQPNRMNTAPFTSSSIQNFSFGWQKWTDEIYMKFIWNSRHPQLQVPCSVQSGDIWQDLHHRLRFGAKLIIKKKKRCIKNMFFFRQKKYSQNKLSTTSLKNVTSSSRIMPGIFYDLFSCNNFPQCVSAAKKLSEYVNPGFSYNFLHKYQERKFDAWVVLYTIFITNLTVMVLFFDQYSFFCSCICIRFDFLQLHVNYL